MTRGFIAMLVLLALALPAWADEQRVGTRIEIRAADLPPPFASPSVGNPPRQVPRPAVPPWRLPVGFSVNIFAEGLRHARWMTVAANGDVLLAEPAAGRITLLRDGDGDGHAETTETFARSLGRVHGLAIHEGHLYFADPKQVWRFPYEPGQNKAAGDPEPVTGPAALGDGRGGHWTRNLVFGSGGRHFYVAVGSRGNVAEESPPRATVQRFNADGGGRITFAHGLRNPVGIAFYPGTDDLYVVVNERDGLGDGLVPDYLTRVDKGAFYGWPYAYIGAHPDPTYGDRQPRLVTETRVPDVLFRSHSAPLGLAFYDADQFPPDYRGDAFVALHGSWNSSVPTGYKIVRVPFANGRPLGHYEVFAAGFWLEGVKTALVWGRPAGLAIAADGSLLVADDVGQVVWRISYGE